MDRYLMKCKRDMEKSATSQTGRRPSDAPVVHRALCLWDEIKGWSNTK